MFLIKLTLLCTDLLLIFFFVKKFMFYNSNFEQKRSDFVSYIRKENDIESLRQIGEINSFGSYERWNLNFSKMLDYFLIATKEKKDPNFEDFLYELFQYDEKYKKFLIPISFLVFIGIGLICVLFYK